MQIFCILMIRLLKSYVKIKLIQMALYDHRSILVLYLHVLITAMEKVVKPRPYQIYPQKTGSCFWSVNYTRSKIPFLCSGNKPQIFKYPPTWVNAFHWHIHNKFCLSKNGFVRQYCISLEKENYNDIGRPLDFRQDSDFRITTLLQR